jgi:hypothetical protein
MSTAKTCKDTTGLQRSRVSFTSEAIARYGSATLCLDRCTQPCHLPDILACPYLQVTVSGVIDAWRDGFSSGDGVSISPVSFLMCLAQAISGTLHRSRIIASKEIVPSLSTSAGSARREQYCILAFRHHDHVHLEPVEHIPAGKRSAQSLAWFYTVLAAGTPCQ